MDHQSKVSCRLSLKWVVCVAILLSPIPSTYLILQQQQDISFETSQNNVPVASRHENNNRDICCPRVYLYDPQEILERARRLSNSELKLTGLDPLNTDSVMFHHFVNKTIPKLQRIPLLTEVARWLPHTPNRPLIRGDKLFEHIIDPSAMMFYTKDYVNSFHLRLAVSSCVVADPADADLFIVPLSVHTDHHHNENVDSAREWNDLFGKITDLQGIFQHYCAETARKHVIFSSSFGHSRRSVGLWGPPYRDPHAHSMQRVALGSDQLIRQQRSQWLQYVVHTPANVISAPFSTLMTYPHELFNTTRDKEILVSSFLGLHGVAKQLRASLDSSCEASADCWNKRKLLSMRNITRSKMQLVGAIIEAKTQSTFCLEPEGDWPTRQSMVQDVLLSCIPVFFSNSYTQLWEPFWGNFIVNASVELDGAAVLRGEVDVMQALRDIPAEEVQRKLQLLRTHRQQMVYLHMNQYVIDGDNINHGCTVDAANILLRELMSRSSVAPEEIILNN